MDTAHHYPPELMALLVDAVPRLLKGKRDLLVFFRGCGVPEGLYADIERTVSITPGSISKFEIVRQVLTRLNDRGDAMLAPRREVLRRVTQWDDFSACWESDRMQAKGYVSEIQKLVEVKDAFTRMNLERERERNQRIARNSADIAERQRIRLERGTIKADLYRLFGEADPSARGAALEGVLNRLFRSHGISVREAFRRVGHFGEGVVEQIDGIVELDGHLYLVEMKWHAAPLGRPEVSEHLVRVFARAGARGLLISHSGFTAPAVTTCRESLALKICILAGLDEIVAIMDSDGSIADLIRKKVQVAIADKDPFYRPLHSR